MDWKMSTSGETHLKTLSLQSQTHYAKLTTLIEECTDYKRGAYIAFMVVKV